jgi:hypothetical protein
MLERETRRRNRHWKWGIAIVSLSAALGWAVYLIHAGNTDSWPETSCTVAGTRVVRADVADSFRTIAMYRASIVFATPWAGASPTSGQTSVGPTWTSSLYMTTWNLGQTIAIFSFTISWGVSPHTTHCLGGWLAESDACGGNDACSCSEVKASAALRR